LLEAAPTSFGLPEIFDVEAVGACSLGVFTFCLAPYPYKPYDFRDGKIAPAGKAAFLAPYKLLK
jgi:hypothetical protein